MSSNHPVLARQLLYRRKAVIDPLHSFAIVCFWGVNISAFALAEKTNGSRAVAKAVTRALVRKKGAQWDIAC